MADVNSKQTSVNYTLKISVKLQLLKQFVNYSCHHNYTLNQPITINVKESQLNYN